MFEQAWDYMFPWFADPVEAHKFQASAMAAPG